MIRFRRCFPALIALCLFCIPAVAQLPDTAPTIEQRVAALEARIADLEAGQVAAPLVEASVAASAVDVSVDREKIAKQIIQSAKDSDLSRRKKRQVRRTMAATRGRLAKVKEQVIDHAASEMLAAGVVVATEDGVEAAINWSEIADFIERMLPVFLTIMQFFGYGKTNGFLLSFLTLFGL